MVAPFKHRGTDADLRAALLAEAIELRDTVGYPLVRREGEVVRSEYPGLAYPLWS